MLKGLMEGKNVLTVAIVLTIAMLLPGCGGSDSKKMSNTMSADVVVVGSGTTGLSAAIQAKQLGLTVMVIEKNAMVGGSSSQTEGYGGLNSNFAAKQGVSYNVRDVFFAAEEYHHWANDQALLLKLYETSGDSANWLESLGVKFSRLAKLGTNKFNTWHAYAGSGKQFIKTLADNCKKMGIDILLETRGTELIMKDGKVAGIKARQNSGGSLTINAPVVVLATGGYSDSPEMLKNVAKVDPETIVSKGVPGRDGDGIRMALAVGASDKRLKGTLMNFGPSVKGVGHTDPVNRLAQLPILFVNQQGNRYIDESVRMRDWGTSGNAQRQQGMVYSIMTKKTLDRLMREGVKGGSAGITKALTMPDFYDRFTKTMEKRKDSFFVADSLSELAEKLNIDKAQLQATVDRYNGFCQTGIDLDYGNKFLFPVDDGPYYGIKFGIGIYSTTDGLEVTTDAQVLDKAGKVIPGLYAGGSDAGGTNGESYDVSVVPGSQQGWAVNSGRYAAKDAARYLNKL
jgi:fumarate reductase flavoprotein subunit